jgi:hypothetical protein
MSTNVERRDQHAPGAVSLPQLGALPAWLGAAAQPERVQSARARSGLKPASACAGGELTLEACEIKRRRVRDKTRCWLESYCVTVLGQGPIREEQLRSALRIRALRSGTPDAMAAL